MTIEKLMAEVLPTVEPMAEVVADTASALDPQAAVQTAQATADAANFAGMVANDPDATQRYLDSLLSILEMADDAGRLIEVLPLW